MLRTCRSSRRVLLQARILSSIGLPCRAVCQAGSCLLLFVNHTADRQLAGTAKKSSFASWERSTATTQFGGDGTD